MKKITLTFLCLLFFVQLLAQKTINCQNAENYKKTFDKEGFFVTMMILDQILIKYI